MKPDGIDEGKEGAGGMGPGGSDGGKAEKPSLIKNVLLAATGQGGKQSPEEAALEDAERRAESSAKEAIRASQAALAAQQTARQAADEAAMDEIALPDEPEEEAIAAKPVADPLDPYSEEQIENMLSPTEEQLAEPPPAPVEEKASSEELELESGELALQCRTTQGASAESLGRLADELEALLEPGVVRFGLEFNGNGGRRRGWARKRGNG